MKHDTERIQRVVDMFTSISSDIDNILQKDWLKVSIISHIHIDTQYPKAFIAKIIESIFEQEDI